MNFFPIAGTIFVACTLGGCGTYVPLKDPIQPNTMDDRNYSREGRIEANLVGNIRCEVQNAIYEADQLGSMPYLGSTWGTQITLKLSWDEMSGLNPNSSLISPLVAMQSFSVNIGASATAHATRVETITFLFENRALLAVAKRKGRQNCRERETGILIESDLRIEEFIYDKATLAAASVATTVDPVQPQFSTFQEDLTFVGTLGGNVTPVWKLTRVNANTAGNLASASRSTTGDVLITLGALATDARGNLLPKLADAGASQHNAGVIGGSVASQNKSQNPN